MVVVVVFFCVVPTAASAATATGAVVTLPVALQHRFAGHNFRTLPLFPLSNNNFMKSCVYRVGLSKMSQYFSTFTLSSEGVRFDPWLRHRTLSLKFFEYGSFLEMSTNNSIL